MAHLSKDKRLLDAFEKGLDIHKATAAEVFGIDLNKVTRDQRRKAKAINFGLIYGMSAFGLAKQVGVGRAAAQAYMDAYFSKYTDVKKYMKYIRDFARDNGFVETVFGRRLYTPNINDKSMRMQMAAERAAINAPMQGSAADIIKLAMIKIHNWLKKENINAQMIMQVHDELVLEAPENKAKEITNKVQTLMSNAAKLSVPLVVDVGIGQNWDEAH